MPKKMIIYSLGESFVDLPRFVGSTYDLDEELKNLFYQSHEDAEQTLLTWLYDVLDYGSKPTVRYLMEANKIKQTHFKKRIREHYQGLGYRMLPEAVNIYYKNKGATKKMKETEGKNPLDYFRVERDESQFIADLRKEEELFELSKITKRSRPIKTPVYQYTKEMVFVKKYDTMKEASQVTGTSQGNISRMVRGKLKSAGGFLWFGEPQEN